MHQLVVFLFIMCGSMHGMSPQLTVNPEQKFVLKEGENTFTITKGYFPYIDKMMAYTSNKALGTAEKPKPLSALNLDIVDQKTLTTMQQLITRINEKDPTFLMKPLDWWLYGRYTSTPQWEDITQELLPPATTSVKNLLDLAHASDFLNAESLTPLFLDVLASRLVKGSFKSEPIAVQSTDIYPARA